MPLVINPGESFIFDVFYDPSLNEVSESKIVIECNDSNEAMTEVLLSGMGIIMPSEEERNLINYILGRLATAPADKNGDGKIDVGDLIEEMNRR